MFQKTMIKPVYPENCKSCQKDISCNLCSDFLCKKCSVVVDNVVCCRPCSASIRDDISLLNYFLYWHEHNENKIPNKHEISEIVGSSKKTCWIEFEDSVCIGIIRIWSSGEIEIEVHTIKGDDIYYNLYRIVDNTNEIDEFLSYVYANHTKNYGHKI